MKNTKQICHRCVNDESFPALLHGSNGSCYTCEGVGSLSQQHSELFQLGFAEEVNLNGMYSMELRKILNQLETIEVKVKRVEGEFVIAKLGYSSPNDSIGEIETVGKLIEFLKES